jgi:trans-aconitate 2-methyltransferase
MSIDKPEDSPRDTRWNPRQYLKFGDHRLRPGLELLDRIQGGSPRLIYDLGCGTGKLTRLLAERWPLAQVIGVDHSKEMLERAGAEKSTVQWIEADLRDWQPESPPDLIFSNATLQWLEGHKDLFPRLLALLKTDGTIAVQMPLSWDMPSHVLMRAVLKEGHKGSGPLGADALYKTAARKWVEEAETYYDLLATNGAHVDLWKTEYLQLLTGDDPVFEWVKGTGLRPILNGLDDVQRPLFLAEYQNCLRVAYPQRDDGSTLYPFRRLFMVATKQKASPE